jgi:hypothetical protein
MGLSTPWLPEILYEVSRYVGLVSRLRLLRVNKEFHRVGPYLVLPCSQNGYDRAAGIVVRKCGCRLRAQVATIVRNMVLATRQLRNTNSWMGRARTAEPEARVIMG